MYTYVHSARAHANNIRITHHTVVNDGIGTLLGGPLVISRGELDSSAVRFTLGKGQKFMPQTHQHAHADRAFIVLC